MAAATITKNATAAMPASNRMNKGVVVETVLLIAHIPNSLLAIDMADPLRAASGETMHLAQSPNQER